MDRSAAPYCNLSLPLCRASGTEGEEKRATTAVPAELDAPTCNCRNRHGGRLTVPRGLGPLAKYRRGASRGVLAFKVALPLWTPPWGKGTGAFPHRP